MRDASTFTPWLLCEVYALWLCGCGSGRSRYDGGWWLVDGGGLVVGRRSASAWLLGGGGALLGGRVNII